MKIDGLPVEDIVEPHRIEVQAKDIKGAKRLNPMSCAVARAAMRQDEIVGVRMLKKICFLFMRNKVLRCGVKLADQRKVKDFDEEGFFEAGVVELIPPPKIGRKKNKPGISGTKPHGDRNAKRKPFRSLYLRKP